MSATRAAPIVLLALAAAMLASGRSPGAEPAGPREAAPAQPARAAAGRTLAERGDPVRGKALSGVCGPCHDGDGRTRFLIYPRIAGQSYEYLFISLKEFRTHERRQAYASQMWPAMEKLSDQDIRDIAAYYSELPW